MGDNINKIRELNICEDQLIFEFWIQLCLEDLCRKHYSSVNENTTISMVVFPHNLETMALV